MEHINQNQANQAARESDFMILRQLFALCAKNNRSTIVSCVLANLFTGVKSYLPVIMSGVLVDKLLDGAAFADLIRTLAIWLAIIFTVNTVANILRQQFDARTENILERQNLDMNEAGMVMDYELLENATVQEKKRRQEQVVSRWGGIYWMLIWPFDDILQGLFGLITALCVVVPLFVRIAGSGLAGFGFLSVGLVAFLLLCVWKMYRWGIRTNEQTKKDDDALAGLSRSRDYFLQSVLSGTESGKDLRIFAQEDLIEEGVCGNEEAIGNCWRAMEKDRLEMKTKRESVSAFDTGCVYLYTALCAWAGLISVGSVVRCAGSVLQCVQDINLLMIGIGAFKNAADFGRDYLDYMTVKNPLYKGSLPVEKRRDDRFLMEFDHVSFKYPGSENYVLRDLNLSLDIGERCAIVGRNGSGKTTFIKLLCRLYDVTEGTIRLNGIDIRKYNYEDYLRLFSAVFQDYRIFSLKAGENIAAGEDVDEERAWDALTRAGLRERFEELPQGIDTFVGKEFDESGVNFSGGERQKLAIARAIYKAGAFVIMDEPTAALDPVSECEVYAGFDKMVGKKTAFYISHRLASCRFCQDILVFDEGKVVQRGSHEELVVQEGLYRELWEAQAQYYTV